MFIVIGLAIAFVFVCYFARRSRGTRRCRWREDRTGSHGALRKYRCAACGADAFTAESGPPRRCLADLERKG